MQGIGAFPTESIMLDTYATLFNSGKTIVVGFIPGLMMIRAIFNIYSSRGTSEQSRIIGDTVVTVLLLASFMVFLKIMLELPGHISDLFPNHGTYSMKFGDPDKDALNDFFNMATIICFWIAVVIYSIILIVISAAGSYLICFGVMSGAYWIPKALFWAIILVSCWPVVWYSLNMAIHGLMINDGFVNALIATIINIIKALSPILGALLALRNPMASSVKNAAGSALKMGATMMSGGTKLGANALTAFGGKPIMDSISSKTDSTKKAMSRNLAKTIPNLGKSASWAAKGVSNFASNIAPKAMVNGATLARTGLKNFARNFNNVRDPYTGKTVTGTSPISRKVKATASTVTTKAADTRIGATTGKVANMFRTPRNTSPTASVESKGPPDGHTFLSKEQINEKRHFDAEKRKYDPATFAKDMYLDRDYKNRSKKASFDWNNL